MADIDVLKNALEHARSIAGGLVGNIGSAVAGLSDVIDELARARASVGDLPGIATSLDSLESALESVSQETENVLDALKSMGDNIAATADAIENKDTGELPAKERDTTVNVVQ